MPMSSSRTLEENAVSIVISGGVGGASSGGMFKIDTWSVVPNNPSSDPSQVYEVWRNGTRDMRRPKSLTIMMWPQLMWMATRDEDAPPSSGACFGCVTLRGAQIPEKIYAWRGVGNGYPYDYRNRRFYSMFASSPNLDASDARGLPNPASQNNFSRQDAIAPDAVNNHIGSWDVVYNGGNGHWWNRQTPNGWIIGKDTPGSNGSIFGPGKTCGTGARFPASCGSAGTATERGTLAVGVSEPAILRPLGGLRLYATEIAPSITDKQAGTGKAKMELPPGVFGVGGGVPFIATSFELPGGDPPADRLSERGSIGVNFVFLYEIDQTLG